MKKLITLVLSIGIVHLCHFDEVYAVKGYVKKRGSNEKQQQSVQVNVVANNSNQPPSDKSNVLVVEELVSSVEKLEIGDDQVFAELQNRQQDRVDVSLTDRPGADSAIIVMNEIPSQFDQEVVSASELKKPQDHIELAENSDPQDLPGDSMQIENGGRDQVSSLPYAHEDIQPVESGQQVFEDIYAEEKQEIVQEVECVNSLVDQVVQVHDSKLFEVVFKNNQEKDVFAQCNNYQFCEFMLNALGRMTEPETVSMVRHYGFGLGHVPLLLVWSSHLFDRLEKSRTYCMETQDLKDILMLMLIIDLRAQVDAACIEHMKKNSHSRNALAVQTDNKVIEKSTASAPFTAGYLKRKLATLWSKKIQEMYGKKKLPCYTTIVQTVKAIAHQWQDDQLQSPIWVCCVMHQSYMAINNLLASWPAERFGNWWNPQQSLITACQGCDYSEIRRPKTDEVLADLEKIESWPEYFGDIYKLAKEEDAEYDSDGGF